MGNYAVGITFNVVSGKAVKAFTEVRTGVASVSAKLNSGVTSVRGYSQSLKNVYSAAGGGKLKKFGAAITKVSSDIKSKTIPALNKFIAKLKGAGGQAKKTGSKVSGMGSKLKSLAAIGIMGLGITSAVSGVAKSLQEVEVAQASLRATAGIDKTSESYKKLDALAEKLAATTQFSKTQVLGAMDAMASQGQSTQQILQGIAAVTTGSAASMGKVDLVTTAQNLGGALGAFQLEAGKSMKVVDMFARATQVTSLKMEDLKNVARDTSIAAGMGQDFGTMTAMVGMIKQIAGSTEQAGTKLQKKSGLSKVDFLDFLNSTIKKKTDQTGKTVIKMTGTYNKTMAESGKRSVTMFIRGFQSQAGKLKAAWSSMLGSSIKRQMNQSDAPEGPLSNITSSGQSLINTLSSGIMARAGHLKATVQKAFTGIMPEQKTVKVGLSTTSKQGVITSSSEPSKKGRSIDKGSEGIYVDFKNAHFYFQGKELPEGSPERQTFKEQLTEVMSEALEQYA